MAYLAAFYQTLFSLPKVISSSVRRFSNISWLTLHNSSDVVKRTERSETVLKMFKETNLNKIESQEKAIALLAFQFWKQQTFLNRL